MKHEIKVEFSNSNALKQIIEKAYFEEGLVGKILGQTHFIKVDESVDEICFAIFKGLNNTTIKITNSEVIDGSMRFMIDETNDEIRIYPISIYCVKEDNLYSFY